MIRCLVASCLPRDGGTRLSELRLMKKAIRELHQTAAATRPAIRQQPQSRMTFHSSSGKETKANDRRGDCDCDFDSNPTVTAVKSSLSRTQQRDLAMERFRDNLNDLANPQAWQGLYQDGLTAWDLGKPTPAFQDELKRHLQTDTTFSGHCYRALVPGCGSAGHDLLALAEHLDAKFEGYDITATVIGLDFSELSLRKAQQILQEKFGTDSRTTRATQINLVHGDFFDTNSWKTLHSFGRGTSGTQRESLKPFSGHFDFIFDNVFFCALPPTLRHNWGYQMANLLQPNTGQLLTLIFPILGDTVPRTQGPPFNINVDDYRNAMEPNHIQITVGPHENPQTIKPRKGMELACWWKKVPASARL